MGGEELETTSGWSFAVKERQKNERVAGHWLLGQERFCFCCLRKGNLHHVFTLMVVNQRGKNNNGGMGESLEHILFLSRLEGMRSRTLKSGEWP